MLDSNQFKWITPFEFLGKIAGRGRNDLLDKLRSEKEKYDNIPDPARLEDKFKEILAQWENRFSKKLRIWRTSGRKCHEYHTADYPG